jgi:ABC-type Fe3+ transport system permease subunit
VTYLLTASAASLSLSEDIGARRTYAGRIFALICWWLVSILLVLVLNGFLSKSETKLQVSLFRLHWEGVAHFELPTSVLVALIGGTTATVIGLFVIVANYFFPKRPPN